MKIPFLEKQQHRQGVSVTQHTAAFNVAEEIAEEGRKHGLSCTTWSNAFEEIQ